MYNSLSIEKLKTLNKALLLKIREYDNIPFDDLDKRYVMLADRKYFVAREIMERELKKKKENDNFIKNHIIFCTIK